MAFLLEMENTIIKCPNRDCRFVFSIIGYSFSDVDCTLVDAAKLIPFTGKVNCYCPCCGINIRETEAFAQMSRLGWGIRKELE